MSRAKLTVRLPEENLDFLRRYAAEQGLTVTEVLDRYLSRLRSLSVEHEVHPAIARISGLVPADVDARALYHAHLLDKHR